MDRTGRRRAPIALCALAGAGVLALPGAALAGVPPASERTSATMVARTTDRDADGRLDAIRVASPTRPPRKSRILVRGYRTTAVTWRRSRAGRAQAVVRLAEREAPDTASRPLVSLVARDGRRLRRTRPVDRARPAMVSARARERRAASLVIGFSERVSFPGTTRGERALRVLGARVASIGRARRTRVIRARIVPGGALPAAARIQLLRARGAPPIRDRSGNAAATRTVQLSTTGASRPDPEPWHTLSDPIDPDHQLRVPFGSRSHWLQPWRAYLDTVPAARFRDAVGINFNVGPQHARAVAELLADSGFRRARIEVGWSEMSYDDPTRLRDPAAVRARVSALADNGIRPLVLLNAHHGVPGPAAFFEARVLRPAAAGARHVQVDAATRERLVPGLSGFNGPDGKAAEYIATSVSASGWVELSKPLPVPIPAGTHRAALLRYPPFAPPSTVSGGSHPAFERTLSGWLGYVGAVTREVRDVLGSDDFDVEIWNEGNFGADFLRIDRYYDPVPPDLIGRGEVEDAILRRTVAYLRDPAHGVAGVRIGSGFASQTPFPAGSTSPAGLTALDKHPYRGVQDFAAGTVMDDSRPVNARGEPEGSRVAGRWTDPFVPAYRAFFPEYYLSAIQTETLVRDFSPITTTIGDVAHGRNAKPAGASTAPEVWITETALDAAGSGIVTAADKRHLQAKVTLRDLSAFVNKGVSALYFYAVGDGDFAMVDPAAADGGETMRAVGRLTAAMAGPRTLTVRRSLTLEAVADRHDHVQFAGDGTPEHPPLYNREVVAFLPFQSDEHRFVVPAYVMTRDMSKVHRPDASSLDPTRFDLPPETYRLTVGGLDGDRLRARATDPLTGAAVPVTIVSRGPRSAVLEVRLTDSPRLLLLDDG